MSDEIANDEGEGLSWPDRKSAVRAKYYQRLESQGILAELEAIVPPLAASPSLTEDDPLTPAGTTGPAPGPDAITAASSARAATSPSPSTATSATDTASSETPAGSPASSMPAESTRPAGGSSTVLTISPAGLADHSMSLITDGLSDLLQSLTPSSRASLQALAIGRAEPIDEVIKLIAKVFVEEEDERAEWPLVQGLEFYLAQYGPKP